MKALVFAGSTRLASYNRKLVEEAARKPVRSVVEQTLWAASRLQQHSAASNNAA
jgi:hypothetical protein